VQEAERRHVARELHDEIGQVLTGLKFSIELISRLPEEAVKANLEEAKNLVNELMGKVRDLSLDLRPAMLDDLGLLPTLLWYFERFTARTQVDVGFEHTGLDRRFLPEVETTAYRIVQEALTNVARHAGADGVSVRLWSNDEMLGLSIEDHGAGFDASDESILNKSNGLAGMRERATLLGGRLTLESTPGLGTNLFAELPFSGRNHISVERNEYDNHSLGG
jgi:signal transduction histidine kinase